MRRDVLVPRNELENCPPSLDWIFCIKRHCKAPLRKVGDFVTLEYWFKNKANTSNYLFITAIGKKLPPPPGCVDQQFTSLTAVAAATVPVHTELPPAKGDTPYALQVLLDLYREQFLTMVEYMKSDKFRQNIENQIAAEKVTFLKFRLHLCS